MGRWVLGGAGRKRESGGQSRPVTAVCPGSGKSTLPRTIAGLETTAKDGKWAHGRRAGSL